jgi:hypothetical protein
MLQQSIELAPRSRSTVAAVLLHAHLVLAAPGVVYAKVERTSSREGPAAKQTGK